MPTTFYQFFVERRAYVHSLKQLGANAINVLLIVVDALRYSNLGCYGYPIPTSPNIDNLARRGLLFLNAFSTSNATDPSITTIMTGRYPISHGIRNHGWKVTAKEVENVRRVALSP